MCHLQKRVVFILCLSLFATRDVKSSPLGDGGDDSPRTRRETAENSTSDGDAAMRTKREIIAGVSDGTVHILPEADVAALCLSAHNYVRSLHPDLPELTWNSTLAQGAAYWADVLVQGDSIRHTTLSQRKEQCGQDCGENIYSKYRAATGDVPDSANAINAWYNEWKCWDFLAGEEMTNTDTCSSNPSTGHLTQMLWKASTQVGCGIATRSEDYVNKKGILKKNKFQNTVIVARYLKPGNVVGYYLQNVPARLDGVTPPTNADELRQIITM